MCQNKKAILIPLSKTVLYRPISILCRRFYVDTCDCLEIVLVIVWCSCG